MTPDKCKNCKYYFNCLCSKEKSYRLITVELAQECGEN